MQEHILQGDWSDAKLALLPLALFCYGGSNSECGFRYDHGDGTYSINSVGTDIFL